ncbi:hypothetical protein Pst134EA_009357 [Puccinia striiformis f. sp. tritici]|uniref:hypothetical protein n=1 Tax=Puccinia striiformis f. sp. tritici TaxID=168172 RepID=UPI002008DA21|nr:hypothetical protein Pst134EA_009357 [Puccinia striiformis f. sp. tritici]KAH9468826.1 hypothetical protein Pst134EA_009357 [Puccinia striiformis f. sp. tritici]KAI9630721.1 hypothetical protein KEM48_013618 [Puccinia striiformis f. sp. tritici PST-130]
MRLHYSCPLLLLQLFIIRELYAAVLPTIPENPVLCEPESVLLKTADAVLDEVVDPLREGLSVDIVSSDQSEHTQNFPQLHHDGADLIESTFGRVARNLVDQRKNQSDDMDPISQNLPFPRYTVLKLDQLFRKIDRSIRSDYSPGFRDIRPEIYLDQMKRRFHNRIRPLIILGFKSQIETMAKNGHEAEIAALSMELAPILDHMMKLTAIPVSPSKY